MVNLPNCPKRGNEYTYEDGHMFICPMCGNEWNEKKKKRNKNERKKQTKKEKKKQETKRRRKESE